MVPIIQFDPATMSLWCDIQLIAGFDDEKLNIQQALLALMEGDLDTSIKKIKLIENERIRARGLQIVSAFWHETRHFHDFGATNYGSFRFRQFLEIYANIPAILQMASASKDLVCPIEIYADQTRCRVMGIENIQPGLSQIAKNLAKRRKMIEKDRVRTASRFGSIEVGGEALLEAIAYIAQLRFVQHRFGQDHVKLFYDSMYDRGVFTKKYVSVIEVAARNKLVPVTTSDEIISVDTLLLECIIFSALQTDHVPRSSGDDKISTSYAAERFGGIATYIRQDYPLLCAPKTKPLDFEECWDAVSTTCKNIFGFTPIEQIALDIDHFEEQYERSFSSDSTREVAEIAEQYHKIRKKFLARTIVNPACVITTEAFAHNSKINAHPNYIICASRGVLGDPPAGFVRLMGYKEPDRDTTKLPYLKWWWACGRSDISVAESNILDPQVGFDNPAGWYRFVDFYAPIAKLLLNGRKIRTMLGPELLFAQQQLKSNYDIDTRIYPSFEFPDDAVNPGVFYFYRGSESLVCDFSSQPIHRPHGHVLTPWTLRRWPKLAKYAIEKMGGSDVAYYSFVRDWSHWIVSDQEYRHIEPLMHPSQNNQLSD